LLAFGTLAMMILPSLLAGSVKSDPNAKSAMQGIELASKILVAVLGFMTIVIGGLSLGIRKKSPACAVNLTVISGLGVLSKRN
jgi:hypothetical protein